MSTTLIRSYRSVLREINKSVRPRPLSSPPPPLPFVLIPLSLPALPQSTSPPVLTLLHSQAIQPRHNRNQAIAHMLRGLYETQRARGGEVDAAFERNMMEMREFVRAQRTYNVSPEQTALMGSKTSAGFMGMPGRC
jgi:hypothetical protein